MKGHHILLLLITNFLLINAQFGSLYSFLEDEGLFSDEEQPRPKTVTRVVSSSRDSSEREMLDREQKVVTDLGHIVTQTNDLFSRLFGMIGGETTMEVHQSQDQETSRPSVHVGTENGSKRDETHRGNDSPMSRVFNLFDSISSIPFHSRKIHGQHICVREITREFMGREGVLSSHHRCQRFRKAQKCIERKESEVGGGRETARIEECCDGWDTDDILSHGCSQGIQSKSAVPNHLLLGAQVVPLNERLAQLNYTNAEELESLGLEKFLHFNGSFTFLVPKKSNGKWRRRGKAMVLQNIQKDYDWSNGFLVKSVDGSTLHISQYSDPSQVMTEINCVPVIRSNLPISNGIIHVMDGVVQPSSKTLLEALEKDGRFKTFLSLMNDETKSLLSLSDEKYTVFAISDEDFDKMSQNVQEEIKKRDGCVKDLIVSHIFRSSICLGSLDGKTLFSLNGKMERVQEVVSRNGTSHVRIGAAKLKDGNLVAGNGVLHVIDDVINPQQLLTWRDHLNLHSQPEMLSSLRDLPIQQPLTILIPSQNSTKDSIFDVRDQVILGKVLNLEENGKAELMNGKMIFYGHSKRKTSPLSMRISFGDSNRKTTRIGCSNVIDEPIDSCHSIIYFIDKPIKSHSMSIVDYLKSRDDLSNFSHLLAKSGVGDLLTNRKTPVTVFVPTNDAFSRNILKKFTSNTTMAAHFVRRYIVDEPLCKTDLAQGPSEIKIEMYENLEGERLIAEGSLDQLAIDGAPIIESELLLSDGIVYVLESTLIHGDGASRVSSPSPAHRSLPLALLNNLFGN